MAHKYNSAELLCKIAVQLWSPLTTPPLPTPLFCRPPPPPLSLEIINCSGLKVQRRSYGRLHCSSDHVFLFLLQLLVLLLHFLLVILLLFSSLIQWKERICPQVQLCFIATEDCIVDLILSSSCCLSSSSSTFSLSSSSSLFTGKKYCLGPWVEHYSIALKHGIVVVISSFSSSSSCSTFSLYSFSCTSSSSSSFSFTGRKKNSRLPLSWRMPPS